MSFITTILSIFSLFFIVYSIYIFYNISKKDGLHFLYKRLRDGILVLFLIFIVALSYTYKELSDKNISFIKSYSSKIDKRAKSVIVGTGESSDIKLHNRFSDGEHILIDFSSKEPSIEIISKRRSAIVNGTLISRKIKNKPKRVNFKDGDIIRLGYSDYIINFNSDSVTLKSLFFTPSLLTLFNVYSTTTIADFAKDYQGEIVPIWVIFIITLVVATLLTGIILKVISSLSEKFAFMDSKKFILYPFLYISLFLIYLFYASLINFTVLEFFQYSVYSKGTLYTILLVYSILILVSFLLYFSYKRSIIAYILFTIITLALSSIFFYSEQIYTSRYIFGFINKSLLMPFLELLFIFSVFGLFAGKVSSKLSILFKDRRVDSKLLQKYIVYSTVVALIALIISFAFKEGAGIVLIETLKLILFFFFTIVLLDDFERKSKKIGFSVFISSIFIFLISAIVIALKDMGSLIQISVSLVIISLFFLNRLKELNLINIKVALIIAIFIFGAGYLASDYLKDNIRVSMWLSPFEQDLEVKNQFFLYYYEQIARGIFLLKSASLFPNDFIESSFLPLANIHTDFIFTLFVNVFGVLGFFSIVVAFIITIFSFDSSITLYQNSKKDIFRFIYGVNVIFVAYIFSYIIVNILSVLQIIPLTDVPFPILTYGRGVLILFFALYFMVAIFNYTYLESVQKRGSSV